MQYPSSGRRYAHLKGLHMHGIGIHGVGCRASSLPLSPSEHYLYHMKFKCIETELVQLSPSLRELPKS